ncbi:MAG: FAD-binding oxidoreductase [Deltaproteobacteria bacterium]|nr:FAD-binding oxidoreductase [Deltaproteobacteria bacterium]
MIKLLKDGPWRQPEKINEPLAGCVEADVAIVGAGVTGLSTALELTERGLGVVVLEQKWVGFGASGTNAGQQASAINEQLLMMSRFVGESAIREYVALLNQALAYMTDYIGRYEIDCGHHRTGSLVAGTSEKHRKKVRDLTAKVIELGGRVRYVDEDEMRERDLPVAFNCAMWGDGGTYQPYQFVNGIRKVGEQKGVRLYEQTPATDIKDGSPVVLKTPEGEVRAKKVLLATNAFTVELPFKTLGRRRLLPVYPAFVETEVLTDEQWQRIGWSGREAICTAHSMFESYNPSPHGTLVGGTVRPQISFGSSLDYEATQKLMATQEAALRRRFPMLDDLGIQHGWGGWVAVTTNFMPMCSNLKGSNNIFYAMAYQGHGVPKATLMGQIASDMLTGKDYAYRAMFTQKALNWPIEPLRYGMFYTVAAISEMLDRRDDPIAK